MPILTLFRRRCLRLLLRTGALVTLILIATKKNKKVSHRLTQITLLLSAGERTQLSPFYKQASSKVSISSAGDDVAHTSGVFRLTMNKETQI